jgi:hypothetical protein
MLAIPPVWLQKDVNPRPHDFEDIVTSAKFLQGLYGNNSTIINLPIYPQHSRCLHSVIINVGNDSQVKNFDSEKCFGLVG